MQVKGKNNRRGANVDKRQKTAASLVQKRSMRE